MATPNLQLVVAVDGSNAQVAIQNINNSFRVMGEQAEDAGRRASNGMEGVTKSITASMLSAEAISAVAKQAFDFVKQMTLGVIDTMDEISKTAQKTGIAVETLSELRIVADMSGVSMEQLGADLGTLSKNMLEATRGGKTQHEAFKLLGVDYRTASGDLRPMDEVLEDVADRFAAMPDGATKSALAMKLFGRAGQEMIPLLNSGSEAMREARAEARQLGVTFTQTTAAQAENFNDNISKLRFALEGLAVTVAREVLPELVKFTGDIVDWAKNGGIETAKEWVSTLISVLKELAKWLAVGALVAGFVKVHTTISGLVVAIRGIAPAASIARAALIALNATPLMAASPWLLAVAGISLFAYELYKLWENIKKNREELEALDKKKEILDALKSGGFSAAQKLGVSNEQILFAAGANLSQPIPQDEVGVPQNAGALMRALSAGTAVVSHDRSRIISEEEAAAIKQATEAAAKYRRDAEMALQSEETRLRVQASEMLANANLSAQARLDIERGLQLRLDKVREAAAAQESKRINELGEAHMKALAEEAQAIKTFEDQLADSQRNYARQIQEFEVERAGIARDAALRQLDAMQARLPQQTPEQQAAFAAKRAAIEIEYARKVHEVKMALFDAETEQVLAQLQVQREVIAAMDRPTQNIDAAIARIADQRREIRGQMDEQFQADIDATQESAELQRLELFRQQGQRTFDWFNQQVSGLFDMLTGKSEASFTAMAQSLKESFLNSLKQIVTSNLASMFAQLFGRGTGSPAGATPSFAGAGLLAGFLPGGGSGGWGNIFKNFGSMPTPTNDGNSLGGIFGNWGSMDGSGGAGGTVPFNPDGSGSILFDPDGGGGQSGLLDLSKLKETWENLSTLTSQLWHGTASRGAALGVAGLGGLLGVSGLRQGGTMGMLKSIGGFALTGMSLGGQIAGPLGAGIGAAIGAAAGFFSSLFSESPEDKMKKKIRNAYGVEIRDKSLLRQLVEMARSSFGGNFDLAIKSPEIQEIIRLYAETSGQQVSGMRERMTATTLVQSGGAVYSPSSYGASSYGPPLSATSLGGTTYAGASSAESVVVNITIPGAKEFFEKETVRVIARNPRTVQSASLAAMKSSYGRRAATALQFAPGTIID